jgi:hypothetical protein
MNNSPSFAITSGCIIAGLIFLVLIILLYRFYSFLFKNKTIFGNTLKTRIISLGITCLFFSTGVTMIFILPLELLFQSLMNFYAGVSDLKKVSGDGFGNVMTNIFTAMFGNLNQQFEAFKIGPAILAIAAWSLIGQFVESYIGDGTQSKPKNNPLRQNVILGLIFVLSIYLSFAAIITVPYFSETTDPNASKEEFLKTQLDEIQKNAGAKTTLMIKPEAPEFGIDTTVLNKIENIPNAKAKASLKEHWREAKEDYSNSINSRKNAFDGLEQVKVKFNNRLTEEATRMLAIFSAESPNLKSQLRIAFRNSLVEHYKGVAEVSYVQIETVNDGIWYADEKLRKDLIEFRRSFYEAVNAAAGIDSSAVLTGETKVFDLSHDYYFGDDLYLSSADYPMTIPTVPSPGDDLGIFRDIAQWLIKPLSMSLVLIVGMLGFGLFGSVISTFVKEAKEKVDKDGMIISDITGVIVRGVSAAIVIFLGVKGGLAIFSSGEGDPNPYALFFTCLVGAVYSEKIWEWAKQKLAGNFKTEEEAKAIPPSTDITAPGDNSIEE